MIVTHRLKSSSATSVGAVTDLRTDLGGTTLLEIAYDPLLESPFRSSATRMGRLRSLAQGLAMREWADALGVSKQAVHKWVSDEPPDRPELDEALALLNRAAGWHTDLASWLRTPLPNSEYNPLRLVREGRWRAARTAVRLKPPVGVGAMPSATMRSEADELRRVARSLAGGDAPATDDTED
jgi:transcriptional regulator with XRE-family HTH domain